MVDIPATTATTASITVGGSTTNTLEVSGDHDWFRINLTSGQAITITLNGVTLQDPYLRIRDSSGAVVYENDDINLGVNLNSQLSFAAQYTGVYYIDVGSYESAQTPGGTGDYQLNVTTWTQPPIYTNDQIVQQLVSGYWGDGLHRFQLDQTRSITVNITGLDFAGQNLALTALGQWSAITGINFVQTGGSAQITFDDNDTGAYTDSIYANGVISTSFVNVDTQWLSDYGPNVGGYAYQAYLHEIGHALGLGHAGNYNTTATYPYDALYRNDAWATSIMSYFDQTENTYFAGQGFDRAFLVTPMVADILAMQQLYGLSTTTRNGDTTYGFNSNAGNPFNASRLTNVAYTIFDTGGIDTLDYSQYSFNQVINLNPETFSDVGNRDGNVSIARGTIIENAIGGFNRDVIIGNSVANVLTGGDNTDTLTGNLGNDTFQDTTSGLNGDTITDFSVGDRIVFTDVTLAGFTFNLSGNTLTYAGGSLTLSAPFSGTLVASAAAGGGVQLAIQPAYDARGDFNGNGRSDFLIRADSGWLTQWTSNSNGSFTNNGSNVSIQFTTDWHIQGIGDFNGDGKDDFLLRNDAGWLTQWIGSPTGGFINNGANVSLLFSNDWKIAGVGDFNGDGRDDFLLRSDAGWLTEWIGNPNGSFTNNGPNVSLFFSTDWKVVGTGDFNGDGKDDFLLRNSAGWLTEWTGTENGNFANNGANVSLFFSNDWHVIGTGDFNGDGKDDFLLRNDAGWLTEWTGNANGSFTNNGANVALFFSTDWHVASIGDFNGDGRDDFLLRNDAGWLTEWTGNANGSFTNNGANVSQFFTTDWHVQAPDLLF